MSRSCVHMHVVGMGTGALGLDCDILLCGTLLKHLADVEWHPVRPVLQAPPFTLPIASQWEAK